MKLLIIAVLGLAFPVMFLFEEVAAYELQIIEKGTSFTEEVDVDERSSVEVFRVPAHNDVKGADFYHDFKMRLTVTRIPSLKVCHISKLDSTLPSPGKLKADIERAALQSDPLPVTTKENLVKVTGPANRFLLTKEALDFCGALPIYNTEVFPVNTTESDGSAVIETKRQRRQTGTVSVVDFTACNKFKSLAKVADCMNADWNLSCRMKRGTCYYYVTCEKIKVTLNWKCKQVHIRFPTPACCEYICP